MNKPEIVSVGVVWDSERPTLEHIMDVFGTVGTSLQLKDVFQSVVDTQWASQTVHNLVGVVTYYGKHYSTFFFHTKLKLWIYFDDATVKEVGPRWEQVVEKCRRGRYQPLLLLYATPNGTPCNTETAPTAIIPFPNMNGSLIPQNLLRRSVTPSPEKPNIGNTRRAITPNPDNHIFGQNRQPINKSYNEYQNLAIIQDNLFGKQLMCDVDMVDGDKTKETDYFHRKTTENVFNMTHQVKRQPIPLHRSLSTGSTSANSGDGIIIPDHLNVPRRRDSGNWSGDRNSTSSSSSTTMENPYLYLVGKIQQRNGSLPGSPTRKGELSSGSSGRYDAGYDSYSLSSTDSLPLQQGLKHNLQLAQIPEYQPQIRGFMKPQMTQDDCERLCFEADQLLDKSRQTEDAHDLETALVLCNAAATKARAAMDAPYNNPHTMTFARMKHNTCIMRARSLHRRMLQEQGFNEKDNNTVPDIRHTREGSNSSVRHSRQNSKDKTSHSRQNSKEMLAPPTPVVEKTSSPQTKNIEIYATLPKKKSTTPKKSPQTSNPIEDEEYMIYDRPNRESRSIFSRQKNKEEDKGKEKRSRSEDRSKITKDLSLAPDSLANTKDTSKKEKSKEDKDDKKAEKAGKKQHKIRRKLLMGGLIRRKNRSMPDLTEANDDNVKPVDIKAISSVDDSNLGLKGMDKNLSGMSGYLSEGHLEYSGNSTNPNLERSKLMRKSFHGSAGKMLTAAKVPPPPPLRTTSQLSGNKQSLETNGDLSDRPPYPLPLELTNNYYYNYNNPENVQEQQAQLFQNFDSEPQSLPFLPSYNDNNANYSQVHKINDMNKQYTQSTIYDSCGNETHLVNNYNTIITKADVHQENSPIKTEMITSTNTQHNIQNLPDDGVDEVDCVAIRMTNLELPPYPSPPTSVLHSRQASEDFPPPPPPLDNGCSQIIESDSVTIEEQSNTPPPTGLLAQLQQKRQQILSQDSIKKNTSEGVTRSTGETWLKELQAKQAALKLKKMGLEPSRMQNNISDDKNNKNSSENDNSNGVKHLTSRFESIKSLNNGENETDKNCDKIQYSMHDVNSKRNPIGSIYQSNEIAPYNNEFTLNGRRLSESSVGKAQIEEEIREVEMLNAAVNRQLNQNSLLSCSSDTLNSIESKVDNILRTKKKSVSFCDQVTLVATAEDQEDDSYIPNPILERVLKSAMNKVDSVIQQYMPDKVSLHRQDSMESQKSTVSNISQSNISQNSVRALSPNVTQHERNMNPEYVRPLNISNSTINYQYQGNAPTTTNNDYVSKSDNENLQLNLQNKLVNGVSHQQVPNLINNTQLASASATIYQGSLPSQMANSYLMMKQPLIKATPMSNMSYTSSTVNQNSPVTSQATQPLSSSPYYSMQSVHSKVTGNSYGQPNNTYQQKQNSMYFPVNRTQPPQCLPQNNNSFLHNTTNQVTTSPYQHVPVPMQNHQSPEVNTQNYDMNHNNAKYVNNGSVQKSDGFMNHVSALPYNNYNNEPPHQTMYNSPYQRVNFVHNGDQYGNMMHANGVSHNRPGMLNQCVDGNQSTMNPYQKVPHINSEHIRSYQSNIQDNRQHLYSYQTPYSVEGSLSNNSQYQSVQNKSSPYQQPPMPKMPQKKSVSFEPGTKGGDSTLPKNATISSLSNGMNMPTNTNINGAISCNNVNNTLNSVNINNGSNNLVGKMPCNLCRKKQVNPPAMYCVDCDFYMSRFKQKTSST